MAGSVNKVILVGNLGANPEIRRAQATGNKIANLRIATSETWKDKQTGERREATEWHSVTIFNENLVEVAEKYLKKGMKVYVEGQQKTRKWQGNDGIERYTTETVLQAFRGELQILEKTNRPQANGPEDYGTQRIRDEGDDYQRQVEDNTRQQQESRGGFSRELDDEIPF